jgi:amidohydrolase
MNLIDPIIQYQSEIQSIRRDLHAHPELRYEENRTADVVAAKLTEWGIPIIRGMGKTGVVGILKQGDSKRSVGLRADMDALPVQETNTFAHASKHQGKMHACGHDGHTAMLLGAAYYLSKHRDFDGTIYLIFQPAEEGGRGADAMIKDGLFEQCPMDAVFGMHNWPGIPVGNFAVCPGPIMASSNYFELKIKGKGSHAAQPHVSIDPVIIGAQIVLAWQTIVSRNVNPHESAVISCAQFHAGSANNIIPESATLSGTVRTFTHEILDLVEQRMTDVAVNTAAAYGAEVEFNFNRMYPPLVNHVAETNFAVKVMQDVVGVDHVEPNVDPSMTGEDFSFMMIEKPGCYVWIGNGEGAHRESGHAEGPCNLHNPSYDFNDELLPIGGTYWVRLAQAFLKQA